MESKNNFTCITFIPIFDLDITLIDIYNKKNYNA